CTVSPFRPSVCAVSFAVVPFPVVPAVSVYPGAVLLVAGRIVGRPVHAAVVHALADSGWGDACPFVFCKGLVGRLSFVSTVRIFPIGTVGIVDEIFHYLNIKAVYIDNKCNAFFIYLRRTYVLFPS